MIDILKECNRALRFLLEVAMILTLSYWGASSTSLALPLSFLLGLALPLFAMLVWGLLVAPKARCLLVDPLAAAGRAGSLRPGCSASVASTMLPAR
ncbi:MAG: YrdB family protein [Thermogemmatispora sp.]|nr:YrdB family protein [Thermogemmatispora sp.]